MKNLSQIHHLHSSGPLGFGLVTYRPHGKFGPRLQGPYQLVVIHRGSLALEIEGELHALPAGHGILLCPDREALFHFSPTEETTHSWCQLPRELLPAELAFPPHALDRPAACHRRLLDFMHGGWKLNGRLTPERRKMQTAAVLMAMWDFCQAFASSSDEAASPLPVPLVKAAQVIEEKLAHSLTLDDLARGAGIGKGRLTQLARQHWRTTPMERLWLARVERAARLLRETGLTISEVADACGFSNPFHFSRRFKQRFGQQPSAWRKAEWNVEDEEASPANDYN